VDVPLPDPAVTAWLFGKLPAHGDFVARGLVPAERQVLDDWLSAEMTAVREALAESFTYRYDAAPPWCFVAEEVSGWRGGAVAPSVDSAGRRFPVLLSGSGANPAAAAGVAEGCEELIYRAFAERWDADRTYAALCTLQPPARADRCGWWTLGNAEFAPAELSGVRPSGLLAAMLTPAEEAA
jgi:type VI secretion system protein ImpM